jgi:hypothetical protein
VTIDDVGRAAAEQLHRYAEGVDVPAGRSIVDRFRRRRAARLGVLVVAVALVAGAVAMGRASTTERPSLDEGLPAGTTTAEGWASIPKAAAGFDAEAAPLAMASNGNAIVVAGEQAGRMAIWRSLDGLHWSPAELPAHAGSLRAIGLDGSDGLALGTTERGPTDVVYRTQDGGETWRAIGGEDPFGPAAPSMGRPSVDGVRRIGDRWVAWGGSSRGDAGIWTSPDGTVWRQELGDNGAGAATVVPTADGYLAHWVTTIWRSRDGRTWSDAPEARLAAGLLLSQVAPGATLAFGDHGAEHGLPTPLLESQDGGDNWTEDTSFLDRYPDAHVLGVDRLEGRWVAAGWADDHPDVWTSADGKTWQPLPRQLRGGPGGTLQLIAAVRGHTVVLGTAPELDRFYVRGVGPTRCPGSYVIDEHTGPDGLPAYEPPLPDRADAERILRESEADLRRRYPGVAHLTVGPGSGFEWEREADGSIAIREVRDWAIYVTLRRASDCPAFPAAFRNGAELIFLAP